MIDVKEAVSVAKKFMKELYDPLQSALDELALEEIDQTDDGRYWLVTLGFSREKPIISMLSSTIQVERVYKTVKVDKGTGEPVAMQIRTV
ncbi:MAG: hypothetical protein SF097_26085 [Acidobacteriota bacterium]|nr:hypothetical protein [Acidobacteriota bacterium]